MVKNRTVFISSTFEDLKTHRKEVWDILTKYDVNIRGMEKFGARKEAPIETCLSEVEQSDIFIGIISLRLGSIDKKTALSFVQCEYEKALDLDKEIYIYLIDEHEGTVNPKHIDYGENYEKLKAFKGILKERHTIDTFKNPQDLADKLDTKFEELLSKKTDTLSENEVDEFVKSKEVMDKFLLLPNTFSDKRIKLKIKTDGEPFPASKAICNSFYLTYGSTLGIKIKILEPKYNGDEFKYLFIKEDEADQFFEASKSQEIEINAILRFSSETIETIRAHFTSTTYIKMPHNWNQILTGASPSQMLTETHTEPAEGQIIIQLKSIIK